MQTTPFSVNYLTTHMTNSITDLIGQTPLVRLDHHSSPQVNIFAKLEGQNPGGSIKDRVALALIDGLERDGALKKESTIIEPSSGNTGIGLAMIGAAKGYRVKIVLPETATSERIKILKAYGAQIDICSKEEWTGNTAIEKLKQLVKENPNYVMPNQYENPACVDVHYRTTAQEIIEQCPQVTHVVAAMGTGGTVTGIGKKMREYNPEIRIVGVEIKPGSKIPGPRNLQSYIPPILDFSVVDDRIIIEDEGEVFHNAERLAKDEGLFYGPSSAAAFTVAMAIANKKNGHRTANIVVIFPDRGDKYLSL